MASAHENPHVDFQQGNYDFYINEVKEFNRRLIAYQEEVNQKLADQDEEIVNFKTVVNGQINQLRGQLADFERELNQAFADYQTQINTSMGDYENRLDYYVEQQLDAFEQQVESINENISVYLEQNLPTIVDENEDLKEAIISAAGLVGWVYQGYFMLNATQVTDPTTVTFTLPDAGCLLLVVPKTDAGHTVSGLYFVPNIVGVQDCIRLSGSDSEYLKLDVTGNVVGYSYDSVSGANPMADVYIMPLDNTTNV